MFSKYKHIKFVVLNLDRTSNREFAKKELGFVQGRGMAIVYYIPRGDLTRHKSHYGIIQSLQDKGFEYFVAGYSGIDKVEITVTKRPENYANLPKAKENDFITAFFSVKTLKGEVLQDGHEFTEQLGKNSSWVPGFQQLATGMVVGETREGVIPPSLGWGNMAVGDLPAHSTIVVEMTMGKIESAEDHWAQIDHKVVEQQRNVDEERAGEEKRNARAALHKQWSEEAEKATIEGTLKITGFTPLVTSSSEPVRLEFTGFGLRMDDMASIVSADSSCKARGNELFQFVGDRHARWEHVYRGKYKVCYKFYVPDIDKLFEADWIELPDILTVE